MVNKMTKSPKFNFLKNTVYVALLIGGLVYISHAAPRSALLGFVESKIINFTRHVDVREGDFIFQHLPGALTEMISDMTQSRYSHCGIIVKKPDGFYVLQAIGPVKETPLNEWISYGVGRQFSLVRLKEKYRKDIPVIIREAYKFGGRPYDFQFEWDDKKIYCSELIYKAVFNATGVRLAAFVRLGDMNWKPYEKTIRELAGGGLPLEREMITPQSLFASDQVDIIFVSR